jgi:hypothetical protein
MATYRITYTDKNKNAPLGEFEGQWRDDDANEVKRVVNNLAALLTDVGDPEETPGQVADLHVEVDITGVTDVTIEHAISKRPAVQVFDISGNSIEAWFKHVNDSSVRFIFNKEFTGKITFN